MSRSRFTSRSSVSPSPRCLQHAQPGSATQAGGHHALAPAAERGRRRSTPQATPAVVSCTPSALNRRGLLSQSQLPTNFSNPHAPAAWAAARRHRLRLRAFQAAAALLLAAPLLPAIAAAWLRAAGARARAAGHQ